MGFVHRNIVAIIVIPSLIGMHYGWSLLQNNTKLVPEGKKIDQPIYTVSAEILRFLLVKLPNFYNFRLLINFGLLQWVAMVEMELNNKND